MHIGINIYDIKINGELILMTIKYINLLLFGGGGSFDSEDFLKKAFVLSILVSSRTNILFFISAIFHNKELEKLENNEKLTNVVAFCRIAHVHFVNQSHASIDQSLTNEASAPIGH